MRIGLLILIIFFAACNQLESPSIVQNTPPPQTQTQSQEVLENLKNKSEWLYPAGDCPVDLIPKNKIEINYLSEGCVDNPGKCLENCRANEGNACYALALLLQEQHGLEQEYSEALFLRSCKLGIISGCTNRAAGKLNKESSNASALKCSADTFEKTCELDDSWGCTMYGLVLSRGIGRKQNLDEALKVLPKACNKSYSKDDPGCKESQLIEKQILESRKNNSNKK